MLTDITVVIIRSITIPTVEDMVMMTTVIVTMDMEVMGMVDMGTITVKRNMRAMIMEVMSMADMIMKVIRTDDLRERRCRPLLFPKAH